MYTYTYFFTHTHIHTRTHTCSNVCIYIYIYIHIYTHMHTTNVAHVAHSYKCACNADTSTMPCYCGKKHIFIYVHILHEYKYIYENIRTYTHSRERYVYTHIHVHMYVLGTAHLYQCACSVDTWCTKFDLLLRRQTHMQILIWQVRHMRISARAARAHEARPATTSHLCAQWRHALVDTHEMARVWVRTSTRTVAQAWTAWFATRCAGAARYCR